MENGGFNVKEYFISEIDIDKLYHLSNIKIQLDSTKRQHLLLTGKNGSGKTSLLLRIKNFLNFIQDEQLMRLMLYWQTFKKQAKLKGELAPDEVEKYNLEKDYKSYREQLEKYTNGVRIELNEYDKLTTEYQHGNFIIAYFSSERKAQFDVPNGVENIELAETYGIDKSAGTVLLKYMVHLKTQQIYAKNVGDDTVAVMIQQWFDRFESALRILLGEQSIHLEYDYKRYNFKICQNGREPFGFNELSDGYSSIIYMVSDLILRMDKNWLLGDECQTAHCGR